MHFPTYLLNPLRQALIKSRYATPLQISSKAFFLVLLCLWSTTFVVIFYFILLHFGICFLNQTLFRKAVFRFALNFYLQISNSIATSARIFISAPLRTDCTFSRPRYFFSTWATRSGQLLWDNEVCKLSILVRFWWCMQKAIIWAWIMVLKESLHAWKFLIFMLTFFCTSTT